MLRDVDELLALLWGQQVEEEEHALNICSGLYL